MKSLIIAVFAICSFLDLHAQWQFLNPKPSVFPNQKVVFTDRQTGYILNLNGDLLYTLNQGSSWNLQSNFPLAICMDMKDSVGIIAGYSGRIYLNSAAGGGWQTVFTGINDYFRAVQILNRDTILLLGGWNQYPSYTSIYRSVNGGKTWQKIVTPININSFQFVNSNTGYIGGASVQKTTDGGLTWKMLKIPNNFGSGISGLNFPAADTGFVSLGFGTLLKTTDGGSTWQSKDFTNSMPNMHFFNGKAGYIAGELGYIQSTNDGGLTFKRVDWNFGYSYSQINSIYFLSRDTGFVVGLQGRIGKTTDGGVSWKSYTANHRTVNDISFPTASTGYAAFADSVYKSTDFGITWNALPITISSLGNSGTVAFEKVHFTSNDTGFAITSNPTLIYRTKDGGSTWTSGIPGQYTYDKTGTMQFLDKKTGLLSLYNSYGGTIVKTTDGGASWSVVWRDQYYGETFPRFSYVNQDTGYALRNNVLYKTTNGSRTWQVVPLPAEIDRPEHVVFTSANHGVLTSGYGATFYTTDGGSTWTKVLLPSYSFSEVHAMNFLNEKIGYLTAGGFSGFENYGVTYKTIDGGKIWSFEQNMSGRTIRFTQDGAVLITGPAGTIMRSGLADPAILPVKITSFTATSLGADVSLAWKSSSDQNATFELQRSDDGTAFSSITKKDVQKNSSVIAYHHLDVDVFKRPNKSVFYRLKTINEDRSIDYSQILKVEREINLNRVAIFPNPATTSTTLQFDQPIKDAGIVVINSDGKKVFSTVANGSITKFVIPTANLKNGIYQVTVQSKERSLSVKLVIAN